MRSRQCIYRGTVHAFEPYEYGREENVLWLHMVKVAAEVLVNKMNDAEPETRDAYTTQISHVSATCALAMDREAAGP